MKNLLLFTNNLRIYDNPALLHAAESDLPIIGIYIDDPADNIGLNSVRWLYQSLYSLKTDLKEIYNFELHIIKGKREEILEKIILQNNIQHLYLDSTYIQSTKKYDFLQPINIHDYNSSCLISYNEKEFNQHSKCLQDFLNHSTTLTIRNIVAKPTYINCAEFCHDNSIEIITNITKENIKYWNIGENYALKKISSFSLKNYEVSRNRLDMDSTSYLSPHLRYGEISPVHIYHQLQNNNSTNNQDIKQFIKQLLLRDFAIYSYIYNKNKIHTLEENQSYNQDLIDKWKYGQTGYKIIDAAMQQLQQTGWMHHRARMLTSSFLIKNLNQPYIFGEKWFLNNLYDADNYINHQSWQWAAGISDSDDGIPSYRIFNPKLQSTRFDPYNDYINKWLDQKNNHKEIVNLYISSKKWLE
jgi:deoxyribodipyrimidine photo-lyase